MNRSIGIFYGSKEGNTKRIAQQLKAQFEKLLVPLPYSIELLDVADYYVAEMVDFDYLVLGISTWDSGQMQADWEDALDELDEVDLSGKQVALFGLGDQVGYPQTFLDAMFFLAEKVRQRGANIVGKWSTDGYDFGSSWAAEDGHFIGLAVDEDNQPDLTEMRLTIWAVQLKLEFGLN